MPGCLKAEVPGAGDRRVRRVRRLPLGWGKRTWALISAQGQGGADGQIRPTAAGGATILSANAQSYRTLEAGEEADMDRETRNTQTRRTADPSFLCLGDRAIDHPSPYRYPLPSFGAFLLAKVRWITYSTAPHPICITPQSRGYHPI